MKSLQIAICAVFALICTVCGIEGGYQLHLSHEHSALSCLRFSLPMEMDPGDPIDPLLYERVPACKDPDELGQPWRLRLVLFDMIGFVGLGTIGFHKGKKLLLAAAAIK